MQDITEAIRATLQNINKVVADNQESVKNSLANLETFTASLARNSEQIDNIMLKVDGVMGKADSLMLGLNSLAGGKYGGELALMVKSISELAEDFDKRSGALMADGRRTLGDISRAVNNLDRNPTRAVVRRAAIPAPRRERRRSRRRAPGATRGRSSPKRYCRLSHAGERMHIRLLAGAERVRGRSRGRRTSNGLRSMISPDQRRTAQRGEDATRSWRISWATSKRAVPRFASMPPPMAFVDASAFLPAVSVMADRCLRICQ